MDRCVIIIWPDELLAADLQESLIRAQVSSNPVGIHEYPSSAELETILDGRYGEPDAIVVGLSDQPRGPALLREIRALRPELFLAAASETESIEVSRLAMRAGLNDYLVPPFRPEDIDESFQPIKRRQLTRNSRGRMISVLPCQGSDGATTAALHMARAITRELGEKALVLDFDFQCSTLALRLGLTPEFTLADALVRANDLDDLWRRIVYPGRDFDLVPSPSSINAIPPDRFRLIPTLCKSASRHYPCVIADLPPGIPQSCQSLLAHSDAVYLICTPEVTSLHLARRRLEDLLRIGLTQDMIHLVVNRMGSGSGLNESEYKNIVGVPVVWKLPNDYQATQAAALKNQLVDTDSELGQGLHRLGCHAIGVEPAARPARKSYGWLRLKFRR